MSSISHAISVIRKCNNLANVYLDNPNSPKFKEGDYTNARCCGVGALVVANDELRTKFLPTLVENNTYRMDYSIGGGFNRDKKELAQEFYQAMNDTYNLSRSDLERMQDANDGVSWLYRDEDVVGVERRDRVLNVLTDLIIQKESVQ